VTLKLPFTKLPGQSFILPVIVLFIIIGLAGATQDIASDGVYVTTLGPAEQAQYVGSQSLCWNGGPEMARENGSGAVA
jgi:MFS transporter, PAT family, beta-lactamase induction signal transducer AmpG